MIDTHSPQHCKDSTAQGCYTKPSRDKQRRVAVSVKEGEEKGGRVRGEERRALFILLHRLRAVEHTCLLRACANQQLAGPREERERGGERGGGEREAVLAGRWSMTNSKWPRMASAVLSRWVKHDGNKGWRGTREETL